MSAQLWACLAGALAATCWHWRPQEAEPEDDTVELASAVGFGFAAPTLYDPWDVEPGEPDE